MNISISKSGMAFIIIALICLLSANQTWAISGVIVYDEAVDGDLSGDHLSPTTLIVSPGSNMISATSVSGDVEYFSVTVPAGHELSAINLTQFESVDDLSFLAVQKGTQFSVDADTASAADLLGYVIFGTGSSHVGTDILDDLGSGSGAIGFAGPLEADDYVFWAQETGANEATYTFELIISEVPFTAVSLASSTADTGTNIVQLSTTLLLTLCLAGATVRTTES